MSCYSPPCPSPRPKPTARRWSPSTNAAPSSPRSKFSEKLALWREDGGGAVAFAIGGADGLHQSVLDRARFTLSLGAMTWPHMLVRALLMEQLWRAHSIATGHPYHRE